MEPFTGPRSVLILHGDEHLRQRRLMLPPFHGEALKRWTDTIAEITHAELDTWVSGEPLRSLERMQAVTLEVIQRVIFGSRDPELRDALRAALDMTGSTTRLIAMSLLQRELGGRGPYGRFLGAVRRIDSLLYERIDDAGGGDSILDTLKATGATREELRDQLVTLLAAGHETTATALAWALERLARHPRTDLHDDAHLDAAVKEVLRTRPVLSITARRVLKPYSWATTRSRTASTSRPACTWPTAARKSGRTPRASTRSASSTALQSPSASSRSAAAPAAASAPRSPRSRCGKCCAR